jgi:hypothetical protein
VGFHNLLIVMENIPEDLTKILGPNEKIELYIRQKIYHPQINIDSVAITNERIILRQPHSLGTQKDYTDFSYQDMSNIVLEKGILRSTIKCTLRFGGDPLSLSDLPNSDAERAYGIIREKIARLPASSPRGNTNTPPFKQEEKK